MEIGIDSFASAMGNDGKIMPSDLSLQRLLDRIEHADKNGLDLIIEVQKISKQIPIIVLTGYSDESFATTSLALGISDYLLKDDLNSTTLYKSIIYNIERNKTSLTECLTNLVSK